MTGSPRRGSGGGSIGGNSSRAGSLGGNDPRDRRQAQSLAQAGITIAPPLGLDRNGRVTLDPSKVVAPLKLNKDGTLSIDLGAVDVGELGSGGDAFSFLRKDGLWKPAPLILPVQFLQNNPTDAQTIYFGNQPRAPLTTAAISKVKIPRDGTITKADIYTYANSVVGSAEAWPLYVRYDNTTDTLVQSIAAATAERNYVNLALSIAVVAGHYVEIKMVNPTWVTNPTAVTCGGWLYLE